MVDQSGQRAVVNNSEEPTVSVWAERGTKYRSEDGAVTVFLTDDHLVVRIQDACHLFVLPELEASGQQPGDYSPDTAQGTGQFTARSEEVVEGDGFLLSFSDNTEADERLMFISAPADDYGFNCEGLQFEYNYCLGAGTGHLHD